MWGASHFLDTTPLSSWGQPWPLSKAQHRAQNVASTERLGTNSSVPRLWVMFVQARNPVLVLAAERKIMGLILGLDCLLLN